MADAFPYRKIYANELLYLCLVSVIKSMNMLRKPRKGLSIQIYIIDIQWIAVVEKEQK
jgi:hypothetical protein